MSLTNELLAQYVLGTKKWFEIVSKLKFIARYSTDQEELIQLFWIVMDHDHRYNNDGEDNWSWFTVRCALFENNSVDSVLKSILKPYGEGKELTQAIIDRYPR